MMEERVQPRNFTEGRIALPLVRFALPVLAALFLQAMYGAVDLLVVGQFGAPAVVSAVSTGVYTTVRRLSYLHGFIFDTSDKAIIDFNTLFTALPAGSHGIVHDDLINQFS